MIAHRAMAPLLGTLLVSIGLSGCAFVPRSQPRFAVTFPEPRVLQDSEAFPHRPLAPAESARLLARGRIQRRATEYAGAGLTGATREVLYFPDADQELTAKWKEASSRLDGINNSPRKELAAYAVQQLFLDPADYPVPVSAVRCVPIEAYREIDDDADPNVDAPCMLGVLSIWLSDVTVPEVLVDEDRFARDWSYAYFLSNFNLVTYLLNHKDGREGNFLVSRNESRRQVFAVDNGVAFHGLFFNWFVMNWNEIRIPAVRAASIERLRALERADLDRLGVLVQLDADEQGVLRDVDPGPNLDPDRGVRERPGVVQMGLTTREIDDVFARIQCLLREVDEGELPLF